MRLLHVGWGFRPWRTGGLIAYVEDVIRGLAARGHEVTYFFAGRQLPGRTDPHVRRRRWDGVDMVELFNCPITASTAGTLAPAADLDHPVAEAAFQTVLERVRPDVVHVQELTGLPSSLLELPRRRGIPVVLSLEDYQLLCPTVKLFDADGERCTRLRPGEMCAVCCAAAPADNAPLVRRTIEQVLLPGGERGTMVANNVLNAVRYQPAVRALLGRVRNADQEGANGRVAVQRTAAPAEYDRRREVNVRRMGDVDAVLAMSRRVAEICRELGVANDRLRVMRFTVRHLAKMRPSERIAPADPLVFTILNGCSSVPKGAQLVVEAVELLARWGLEDRLRLHVWGFVWPPPSREALTAHPFVELRGNYVNSAEDLTRILAEADVGVVPSVWEEAYGYTGVEMLAAGVPVLGNALGGITDYVHPGETGWLNEDASAAGLAEQMRRLVEHPAEVERLRRGLRARRPESVMSLDEHLDLLEAVYEELVPARAGTVR